jgi:hypothetical protein
MNDEGAVAGVDGVLEDISKPIYNTGVVVEEAVIGIAFDPGEAEVNVMRFAPLVEVVTVLPLNINDALLM